LSKKKVVEKIIHTFYVQYFFFENRAFYGIIQKNTVEPDRPKMTVWRMRISFWITKATNIQPEYITFIALSGQQWLHERASMLRYTYIVSLVTKYRLIHTNEMSPIISIICHFTTSIFNRKMHINVRLT
jgi:hypothetical protein